MKHLSCVSVAPKGTEDITYKCKNLWMLKL